LLDGLGGLLTALMLCLVLPSVHEHIGLPPRTLVNLGLCGAVCGAYSLSCYRFVTTRWRLALGIVAGANVVYCVVSAAVVGVQWRALTTLGLAYFAGEIIVILSLVALELAVLKRRPA